MRGFILLLAWTLPHRSGWSLLSSPLPSISMQMSPPSSCNLEDRAWAQQGLMSSPTESDRRTLSPTVILSYYAGGYQEASHWYDLVFIGQFQDNIQLTNNHQQFINCSIKKSCWFLTGSAQVVAGWRVQSSVVTLDNAQ